jgi:AcrR family transcriptional regulator
MAELSVRRPNRRGEGVLLRPDIVRAATALVEETGNEDAVTLRGVARKVGISAPSIYGHFEDAEAVLEAVIEEAFDELTATLRAALGRHTRASTEDPEGALLAVCRAYVDFARERPNRYRVMFGRHRASGGSRMTGPRATSELLGGEAFDTLATAVAAVEGSRSGRPDEVADTLLDATALWVALHGYAGLQSSVPAFPWPDADTVVETLVGRLLPGTASRTSPPS